MAIDWDYFYNQSENNTSMKDRFINDMQANMDSSLNNMYIQGFDVKIGMDFFKEKAILLDTGEEFDCVVDYDKVKEKTLNSLSRKIRYKLSAKIKAGSYIEHQFKYSDEPKRTYIVITQPDPHRGYELSYMTECCFD